MVSCHVCGHCAKPIEEIRESETLYSCSHCGIVLLRIPRVSKINVPMEVQA